MMFPAAPGSIPFESCTISQPHKIDQIHPMTNGAVTSCRTPTRTVFKWFENNPATMVPIPACPTHEADVS